MNGVLIALLLLTFVASAVFIALLAGVKIPGFGAPGSAVPNSLRNLREAGSSRGGATTASAAVRSVDAADGARVIPAMRRSSSALDLQKKLRYAQLTLSPLAFRLCEVSVSVFIFALTFAINLNILFSLVALFSGPLFMGWVLNLLVDRRFKAFDADYSPFLLSMVSLLKTGMNIMSALEAAAKGLEDTSLVRQEVEQMVERLRFGVSEERSIGAFGEDVYHPEIELFVQALLLSKRVGGTLSDTLERLARQVRRRQFFRSSAAASISQQRGSIWVIIGIMVGTELYMYFIYPDLVTNAIKNDIGWMVWQGAFMTILGGIYWIRQITKIRV